MDTHIWQAIELTFTAQSRPANTFRDMVLWVEFNGPRGERLTLPGFWDGENIWKVRFAPTSVGEWKWQSFASDLSDRGLHGQTGRILVSDWSPAEVEQNPHRRGFVRVAPNGRYFTWGDGTPFYWLGDTLWAAFQGRVREADFERYLQDRKLKGFTVIQLLAGRPYGDPTQPASDLYWADDGPGNVVNEAGAPFLRQYDLINPAYFQVFERKLFKLLNAGLTPCLFGLWGQDLPRVGLAALKAYWGYLVARYAAYNVLWCVAGEYLFGGPDPQPWREVGEMIHRLDPYGHPTSIHSTAPHSASRHYQADDWYDFNLIQVGHAYHLRQFIETLPYTDYHLTPVKPTIMSESWYENHATCLEEGDMRFNDADIRFVSYVPLLQGCVGQTYGAHGIWSWAGEKERSLTQEKGLFNAPAPWWHDLELPGSAQMKHLRALFESVRWWKLEPHPEWVSIMAPRKAYCAAAPGEEYVVYVMTMRHPALPVADSSGATSERVLLFLPPVTDDPDPAEYPGRWFDPRTGEWCDAQARGQWYGSYLLWSAPIPDGRDWVLVVRRKGIRCGR